MNISKLSKRERFYFDVGEGIAMNDHRCVINLDTLEVVLYTDMADEWLMDDEEDEDIGELEEKDEYGDPEKFMIIEPVTSHEAFEIMENFADSLADMHMRQRLLDALSGSKPFANFNRLVHTTDIREDWFDFKNTAYTELAKEWLELNAKEELKKKIMALPALWVAE